MRRQRHRRDAFGTRSAVVPALAVVAITLAAALVLAVISR